MIITITNIAMVRNFELTSHRLEVESKVKLFLCLIKYHSMKMYGEVEV